MAQAAQRGGKKKQFQTGKKHWEPSHRLKNECCFMDKRGAISRQKLFPRWKWKGEKRKRWQNRGRQETCLATLRYVKPPQRWGKIGAMASKQRNRGEKKAKDGGSTVVPSNSQNAAKGGGPVSTVPPNRSSKFEETSRGKKEVRRRQTAVGTFWKATGLGRG